jgi:DNA topoisomerase-2
MEKVHRWILPKDSAQFEYREISYVPALYKMFDEVLVNAADNFQRDKKMNLLQI